jgi:hypothetical protein
MTIYRVTKICIDCGALFDTSSNNAHRSTRCIPCRDARNAERENERRRVEPGEHQERIPKSRCVFSGFLRGVVPEPGDENILGRRLSLTDVKTAPPGFLPNGLMIDVIDRGGSLIDTGVVINGRPVFEKVKL